MQSKQCTKCLIAKTIDHFYRNKSAKDGMRPICKECSRTIQKEYDSGPRKAGIKKRFKTEEQLKKRKLQKALYNKKYQSKYRLKYKYNMTESDYNILLDKCGGICQICSNSNTHSGGRKLFIDHCHTTGKVRGLLCHHCNAGIGYLKESKEILLKSIEYLEKYNESISRL